MKNKILVLLLLMCLVGCNNNTNQKEEYNISNDQNYIKGEEFDYAGAVDNYVAEQYWDASNKYYYEYDFDNVIYNCEMARDYYLDAISECNIAISFFEEANKTATGDYLKIINYKIKGLELFVSSRYDKYEACEYLELAATNHKLRNEIVVNASIASVNEKIISSDKNIREMSIYLSKVKMLENKTVISLNE